ncbi:MULTISPECIES: Dps family protein [Clostridia]|uniref:Dps family protein n=1 Tax=Clostridia TaxID=186801 RepID=UPI000EA347EF|nr:MULTISPECIES: Dps family protein [Clostridia]NBJ68704.1 DNA starvation/stationary phase protection protein [Roseburia sp. 1XD42-34]RKI80623.1 DNA starvation/stationary phase protection protein [Clostridium sp. 1xD42-85]
MNQQLVDALNKQLANWNILYTKLHHYHWYVDGAHFFTLHEKFEEYYDEAAGYIDEIAERVLTIKGKPLSSLKAYLEAATINEAEGKETDHEMVAQLAKDFQQIVNESNEIIEVAEESQDQPTSDLFIGIKASLEKHIWMLDAFNAKQ